MTLHQLLTHSAGIPDCFVEAVMEDYEALRRGRPMYADGRQADAPRAASMVPTTAVG